MSPIAAEDLELEPQMGAPNGTYSALLALYEERNHF